MCVCVCVCVCVSASTHLSRMMFTAHLTNNEGQMFSHCKARELSAASYGYNIMFSFDHDTSCRGACT